MPLRTMTVSDRDTAQAFTFNEDLAQWTSLADTSQVKGEDCTVADEHFHVNEYANVGEENQHQCMPCEVGNCSCVVFTEPLNCLTDDSMSTDSCFRPATSYCTQTDCPGPADLVHLNVPLSTAATTQMQMQYTGPGFALTYEQWAPHAFNSQAWQQALHEEQIRHFLQAIPVDRRHFMYDGFLGASATTLVSDVETQSMVEASVMRRASEASVQSSLAIAAGMQAYYDCKVEERDQSLHNNLYLDQHVMNTIVAPQQYSRSTLPRAQSDSAEIKGLEGDRVVATEGEQLRRPAINRCCWTLSSGSCGTEICNAIFDTAPALTEHIKSMHVGARRKHYTCQWLKCDRAHGQPFPQKQKIMRHMVVHTGDRPFACNECDYECSEESALKQHKRKHTGERPFKCEECKKRFRASTSLSVHLRIHSGEKPLECRICKKRFSESSNMAKHMRTHSDERPHKCNIGKCTKSFQRPDQLKRHKRLVHKVQFAPPQPPAGRSSP